MRAVILASALLGASAAMPDTCIYSFEDPGAHTFFLPPAQPEAGAGDKELNPDNPIYLNDKPVPFACNSNEGAFVYDPSTGEWLDSYLNNDGQNTSLVHQFYASDTAGLFVATIQESSNPSLYEAICDNWVRLLLDCNNNASPGCLEFRVVPSGYYCPGSTQAPTAAPSAAPTPAPSAAETPAPTPAPVAPDVTPAPSASPTPAPVAPDVTPAPTASPTPAPVAPDVTPAPTASPTPAPVVPVLSPAPTPSPVFVVNSPAPTPAPTWGYVSSFAPTGAPTFAPTAAPTAAPTWAPTYYEYPTTTPQTPAPTLSPTLAPSPQPVVVVTPAPSVGDLTSSPTPAPSAAPPTTHAPTEAPAAVTPAPVFPTVGPSPKPTPLPTPAPSAAPTSLTFAPTAAPSSASTVMGTCQYRFKDATSDMFQLPPAQPTAGSGDAQLNVGNPIVDSSGNAVFGCNGNDVTYYDSATGMWTDSYTDNNGVTQSLSHQFYATAEDQLNVATIQASASPSLFKDLCNTEVRLELDCNNGQTGCIAFYVVPDVIDYTCPTV